MGQPKRLEIAGAESESQRHSLVGPERPDGFTILSPQQIGDTPHGRRHYSRATSMTAWIVNLVDNVLEVYRRPERAASVRFGWKYGSVRLLRRNALTSPLVATRARIRVAALLP